MIRILRPNDFHHHLRDGKLLKMTTQTCFEKFNHVIVMPNLVPPIVTIDKASNIEKIYVAMRIAEIH